MERSFASPFWAAQPFGYLTVYEDRPIPFVPWVVCHEAAKVGVMLGAAVGVGVPTAVVDPVELPFVPDVDVVLHAARIKTVVIAVPMTTDIRSSTAFATPRFLLDA